MSRNQDCGILQQNAAEPQQQGQEVLQRKVAAVGISGSGLQLGLLLFYPGKDLLE